MAPITFQQHSCVHCQKIVIDERKRAAGPDEEGKNFIDLNFSTQDIFTGAAQDCTLCTWLVETEWIHRSATVDEVMSRTNARAGYESVIRAVAEASIRQDEWLPPLDPTKTLQYYHGTDQAISVGSLKLVCFFMHGSDVKFFGLWDSAASHMVYRTRTGFSVFTSRGNPAARMISTKPIERDPFSEQSRARVSGWMNECLHGQIRSRRIHISCPRPSDKYLPKRLIHISKEADDYQLKLVETENVTVAPYITLSYCWGGDQPVKSTKALYNTWQDQIPWETFPETFRDAVTVAQALQVNYLWIDAFCIIQDDDDDKAIEIAQMPKIYRNAMLTIAASRASRVQEGFLDSRTGTHFPNLVFQLSYQTHNPEALGSIMLIKADITGEPLDTRGWALQERLLSPRTLEFGTRQLRFICQHNPRGLTDGWRLAPEDSKSRQDNIQDLVVMLEDFGSLQDRGRVHDDIEYEKAMENWFRLIKAYTHRHLTLPRDKILAISGIAERYGKAFEDQYCAGMWRSTFARALYWTAIDKKAHKRTEAWQGPSWSWLSANGPVEFPTARTATLIEDEPRIVAFDIELANPDDPYGTILEGSGRLTLKVRLLPAILKFHEGMFGKTDVTAASIAMNSGGNADIFRIRINYDHVDASLEERDKNNAVFFELSSHADDKNWYCKGLIARSEAEDAYVRVGSFNYVTEDDERRRPHEDLHAWHARVNRELNWFAHCSLQTVDII